MSRRLIQSTSPYLARTATTSRKRSRWRVIRRSGRSFIVGGLLGSRGQAARPKRCLQLALSHVAGLGLGVIHVHIGAAMRTVLHGSPLLGREDTGFAALFTDRGNGAGLTVGFSLSGTLRFEFFQ